MLFLASSGSSALLQVLMTEWIDRPLSIRLFKNDYSPSWLSTLADFVESDFAGYDGQSINGWFFQGFAGQIGYIVTDMPNTFQVTSGTTAPQLCFGYYVHDQDGNLLWGERDPVGPVDMSSEGNEYQIFARFGLANCPP